jgi:hypothetical protein
MGGRTRVFNAKATKAHKGFYETIFVAVPFVSSLGVLGVKK